MRQHAKSERHEKLAGTVRINRRVTDMFQKQSEDSVTKAEVLLTNFIAEHNLPFLVADHFTDLVQRMFPDSATAQNFKCKRTKSTHILCNSIAPFYHQQVTKLCQNEKFCIMIDESNDKGDDKCMVILVRIFDTNTASITTKFIGIPICNFSTAADLFEKLNTLFKERDIPWENCIGYISDNANVMIGKKNSVLSRIQEQNPNVYNLGCICHLANLCAQAGIKTFPVPIEDLLVDIYFHFHHSAKRKEIFSEFLEFTNVEPMKIIKHCSTRWLSLEKSIKRIIHLWPALRSYFCSNEE